jgi:hypothetical protein
MPKRTYDIIGTKVRALRAKMGIGEEDYSKAARRAR